MVYLCIKRAKMEQFENNWKIAYFDSKMWYQANMKPRLYLFSMTAFHKSIFQNDFILCDKKVCNTAVNKSIAFTGKWLIPFILSLDTALGRHIWPWWQVCVCGT